MNETKSQPVVLLVDDELEFREAMGKSLGRRGFEVVLAENGERALVLLAEAVPDVIILDLRMEGMDGLVVLDEIRRTHRDLPVIILTGHGRVADVVTSMRMEVMDFLQKPVDVNALATHIRALLARRDPPKLHEPSLAELMTPLKVFARVRSDQTVREAMGVLLRIMDEPADRLSLDAPRRVVLVFDDRDKFVGLIRCESLIRASVPRFLRDSPWSTYYTGMFMAQAKVMGSDSVEDLLGKRVTLDVEAPLMEAAYVMSAERIQDLPLTRGPAVVGILRGQDLFRFLASTVAPELQNSVGK